MKKILLLMTFVFGVSYSAWASACVSGDTLTDYLGLPSTGCTVGDLTFSDFKYISSAGGGATVVQPSDITVDTVTSGFGSDIGLEFNAGWVAGSGETKDSDISYTVSTTNPGGITDLNLQIVGGANGNGIASAAETSTSPSESLLTQFETGDNVAVATATFGPQTTLNLSKDIDVTGGVLGAAHISLVYNLFSEGTSTVPEPSLLLLSVGLLGFVPFARRKFVR
jgi:hypothetical protein